MRHLRIVGVDTDSNVVECEIRDTGEKLSLPLDDRLRAAARGEFVPAGTGARPPVTGTLRPREIQDRIRHGASPEDVASEAGVPLSRIEGFAVPVLLERATAADLAKNAHPVLPDGPALDTLADRLGSALDRRGIDPDLVRWDAWRDRSGGWVIRTSWPAGLSDDASATWSFVPDSHGGAAHALDDEAHGILDPSRAVSLRTVPSSAPPLPPGPPPVRAVQVQVERPQQAEPVRAVEQPRSVDSRAVDSRAVDSRSGESRPADSRPAEPARSSEPRHAEPRQGQPRYAEPRPGEPRRPVPTPLQVADAHRAEEDAAAARGSQRDAPAHSPAQSPSHSQSQQSPPQPPAPSDETAEDDFLQHPPAEPERRHSRRHPTMPSWEDVLLGVRSKDD